MNSYFALAIVNSFISIAVLGTVYITNNPWCLVGFVFLMSSGSREHNHKCPKCGTEWEA